MQTTETAATQAATDLTTVPIETEAIQIATESAATEETTPTQEETAETTSEPTEEPEATQATDSELEEDQLPIVPA